MPNKKPHSHVGPSLDDVIARRKAASPTFSALFDEELGKLALARQVRELREQENLSQEELAKRIGTKQPAIARLESGRVVPKLDLLQRIATALGRDLQVRFVKRN